MQNFDQTIISQYHNSATLVQLITNLNTYIDPQANLQQFYDLIWNIDTAQGYGLDVWGRIVGVGRVLEVAAGSFFGFGEAGDRVGFGQGPFYEVPATSNFTLTDPAYRALIFAKAAANITDCSIPAINQILLNLFPSRGNCYVVDGPNQVETPAFGFGEATDRVGFGQGPFVDYIAETAAAMTMVYVFDFALRPYEISIVLSSGVLPKPTGVKATASYLGVLLT